MNFQYLFISFYFQIKIIKIYRTFFTNDNSYFLLKAAELIFLSSLKTFIKEIFSFQKSTSNHISNYSSYFKRVSYFSLKAYLNYYSLVFYSWIRFFSNKRRNLMYNYGIRMRENNTPHFGSWISTQFHVFLTLKSKAIKM